MTGTSNDEPSTDDLIDSTATPILEFGRGWMMDSATGARANELGFEHPMGFWVNGRAGFLGEVDADVAAAAIGFMSPSMVRRLWDGRPAGLSALGAIRAYAEAAADWSRRVLADTAEADVARLVELADRVAEAAQPSAGVLFTGWRSLDRPADPAGAAAVALNTLRELRGGAHLSAVNAIGLGPHRAIMSTDDPVRGGPSWAENFGWKSPHPDPDPAARAEAERLTTAGCREAYGVLHPAERVEFRDLMLAARAAMDRGGAG